MSHKIVDFGQSARARLLALANRQGIQLEYVLLRYALERYALERFVERKAKDLCGHVPGNWR